MHEVEWGKGIPLDNLEARLKADSAHEIKAVLATHNETATGVTSDMAGVRKAMDASSHPALLFVDGVSSIASLDFRMRASLSSGTTMAETVSDSNPGWAQSFKPQAAIALRVPSAKR
jgi:hypothetical protein